MGNHVVSEESCGVLGLISAHCANFVMVRIGEGKNKIVLAERGKKG